MLVFVDFRIFHFICRIMSTNVVYPVALATNGEYRLSCLVLGCDSRDGFVGLYINILHYLSLTHRE